MTGPELAEEYVTARSVLLDALSALDGHLANLVLVGAQAVYHHTGSGDLTVPLMTTDADLAVDTRGLASSPEIGTALRSAGFVVGPNPGHWVARSDVAVDLMVVPHQAGTAKATARAARVAPHDKQMARIARGLEASLIDNAIVEVGALTQDDDRRFDLRVAGPAALLTAKLIKIEERLVQAEQQPDRVREKDALDAFRLLQAIDVPVLVAGFARHQQDEHAAPETEEAIAVLRRRATSPDADLPRLAAAAAGGNPVVAPSMVALVEELLGEL